MRYELNDNSNAGDGVAARLTAYALGELEDVERAEVEVMLQRDPAARAEVESIRAVAGIISRELASETGAALSTAQRETIEARAAGRNGPVVYRFPHRRVWSYAGLTALAASIALIFIVPLWINPDGTERRGDIAMNAPGDEVVTGNELDDIARAGTEAMEVAQGQPAAPQQELRALREELDRADAGRARDGATDEFLAEAQVMESEAAPAERGAQAPGRERALGDELRRDAATPPPSSRPSAPGGAGMPGGGGGGFAGGMEAMEIEEPLFGATGLDIERREQVLGENDPDVQRLEETQFAQPTGLEDSTFSIDVDTASYSILRRSIMNGHMPLAESVRIEEMLNYFTYNDAPPSADDAHPFASHIEIAACPWNPRHRLARVSLKGRAIDMTNRVGSNIVFLIDVSGSMNDSDKLPLVKESLKLLVNELTEDDRISIVTYAGQAGVALQPTAASPAKKMQIVEVIDSLGAGGSTAGSEGIATAYELARQNFIEGGLNRVILATDGDFNVGISDNNALVALIEEKRESGIYLTTLGFGTGNVRDSKLEQLADHGNGNYSYIDSLDEGKRVLVEQIGGTLFTIAENVKIQIDFNPEEVGAYRLIGYENRRLAARDFRDDQKDAGEIGAGHGVTALYEIIPPHLVEREMGALAENRPTPGSGGSGGGARARDQEGAGAAEPVRETDAVEEARDAGQESTAAPTRPDQEKEVREVVDFDGSLLRLKLRYRDPATDEVREFASLARDERESFESASADFQFAAAVATFGLVLRDSQFKGDASFTLAEELALPGADPQNDPTGYRGQFLELVRRAKAIAAE
jgi:Ca-activated chloride channel family protein